MGQRNTKRSSGRASLAGGDSRPVMEAVESRLLMSYSPAGGDSLVNTYTAGEQSESWTTSVATDVQGNYVAVWESQEQNGVYARAFGADGTPRTGEFRVSQAANGDSGFGRSAEVAMEANGDFVVVWQSSYAYSRTLSYYGVYARRYTAGGLPLGNEFRVDGGGGDNMFPSVAMDQDGDFVVAWQGPDAPLSRKTPGGYGIIAQRFNQSGQKVGGAVRVNSYVPEQQQDASVAIDAAGSSFVVTWRSRYQDGAAGYNVYAKRFGVAADGSAAAGAEFKVNAAPTGPDTNYNPMPVVAMRADGGEFTIGWKGIDADRSGIYARRYGAGGQPLSAQEFPVNTTTRGQQAGPQAAYDAAGNSIIAWTDNVGTASEDVFAQAFDAGGRPGGGEIVLNAATDGRQERGSLAFQPGGNFVAVFTGTGADGSRVVFARRFVRDAAPSTAAEPAFGDTAIADPARSTDGSDASAVVDLAAA